MAVSLYQRPYNFPGRVGVSIDISVIEEICPCRSLNSLGIFADLKEKVDRSCRERDRPSFWEGKFFVGGLCSSPYKM